MSWRCTCGAYNGKAAKFCEACGGEHKAGTQEAARGDGGLEMYRERPDRRASFRACEHVAAGTLEPCLPCAAKLAELRRQFRAYGAAIERRTERL